MFAKTTKILIAILVMLANASSGLCKTHCGGSIFDHPELPGVVKGEGSAGVGMEINQDRAGHYVVVRLEPDGPAARKKVLIGDTLIAVDEVPVNGLNMDETVKLIRGESETSVRLKLQSGRKSHVVTIKRQVLAPSNQLRPPTDEELKNRKPTLYDKLNNDRLNQQ